MAAQDGSAEYPVIDELLQHPQRFSFYQAVKLLEQANAQQQTVSVGYYGPCGNESIRFRPYASLGFASADIKQLKAIPRQKGDVVYRMDINFLGLYGATSPLPAFYTEAIIQHADSESNRRDFLDLFHHRIISLHYRTQAKYLLFEQIKSGLTDPVSNWLFALIGLKNVTQLDSPPLTRLNRLLANMGLLATQNRSGAMISRIISHYFGRIPVEVQEFIPRKVNISHNQQVRLGKQQSTLGEDITIGAQVDNLSGKFRLWIGPLSFTRFNQFLPGNGEYEQLIALIRYLLRDPLAFDIGLKLHQQDTPLLTLANNAPCRLGWSSWLGKQNQQTKSVILGHSMI